MDSKPSKPPLLKKIIRSVCLACKVGEGELDKSGWQRKVTKTRAIIARLSMKLKSATLTELARKFNRDVSTMSLAMRKIEKRRAANEGFRCQLDSIENSINKA